MKKQNKNAGKKPAGKKKAAAKPLPQEQTAVKQPGTSPFPIVGIGASAGGLEAFEQFFRHMPPDSEIAFVLVPHLDPSHASMMTELLKRVTKMTVLEAADGMKVQPNHVYCIPPNKDMSIFGGTLQLNPIREPRGLRMPIDIFFRSLAEDQGEGAFGVIFSGTGTDGTLGVRAIHGAGGMTMAQDPATAKYSGMPSSAISTGFSDYVLPPEKMPEQLVTYVKTFYRKIVKPPAEIPGRKATSLMKILALLRSQTGHDFSLYKKTTINRRIEKRMSLHNIEDLSHYVRYNQEHPDEVQMLFKDLLIGVTNFFRDREAFDVLRKKILVELLENKPEDYNVRVWIAGCGTGEEAYSIAMLISEYLDEINRKMKVQIFATDIDQHAINFARTAAYSGNIAADVAPERLKQFFIKEEIGYRVKKEIREMVVFALHDVAKDPPFTKLDLISCRNLLIYLEPELQNKLLPLFHYSLKPEGILFLGSSESIGKFADLFAVVEKKWKFFTSKRTAPGPQPEVYTDLSWTHPRPYGEEVPEQRRARRPNIADLAQKLLLDSFAPPSVIINETGDIFWIHGQTGKYLTPAPGQASLNVVEMAREGIRFELRSALHQAFAKKMEKIYKGLQVKTNEHYQLIDLFVRPLKESEEAQDLAMVSFVDVSQVKSEEPVKKTGKPKSLELHEKRVKGLEQEIIDTKETLQATIEEFQAGNEELRSTTEEMQSTNEELQSTNEELETSKEELQSINEELVTLNSELQAKIDEVSQTENDMRILLDSTNIGIIFLDGNLCIKRFTFEATKLFNLIPTDVGRSINDIRSNLQYDSLGEDARQVIETLQTKDLEVRSKDGQMYVMRITPYRTFDHVIEGAVVTLTNITELKQLTTELGHTKIARQYAESIVETVREPLVVLDESLRIQSANRSFYKTFQIARKEAEHKYIYDLGKGQWNISALRELLEEVLPSSGSFEDFTVEYDFPRVGKKKMLLNARRIAGDKEAGKPLILLAIEDVTGK